jgi:hypothetical protein
MKTASTQPTEAITIRPAYADDDVAVRRLAALDSAPVPTNPLLLAEVDGELRAAVSLRDGRAIADPFEYTAGLVALLELHAAQCESHEPPAAIRRPAAPSARLRPLRSHA